MYRTNYLHMFLQRVYKKRTSLYKTQLFTRSYKKKNGKKSTIQILFTKYPGDRKYTCVVKSYNRRRPSLRRDAGKDRR